MKYLFITGPKMVRHERWVSLIMDLAPIKPFLSQHEEKFKWCTV